MEIVNGQLIDKITTYDEYLESDEMARKRTVYTKSADEEEDKGKLNYLIHNYAPSFAAFLAAFSAAMSSLETPN